MSESLQTFSKLINMGFDEHLAMDASKKYPNNVNKGATYIISQQQKISSKSNPSSLPSSSSQSRIEKVLKICATLDSQQEDKILNVNNYTRSRHRLVCQIADCPFEDADETLPTQAIVVQGLTQKDKDHIKKYHISC